MILKRQLQRSTETNQKMKNVILALALKAFLCPCYTFAANESVNDTIFKPEFLKTSDGIRFVYRNSVKIKLDEEVYDQIWYSIDIIGELKCYTFASGLYFFVTNSGEYLLIETDYRRINFGQESLREINWQELVLLTKEARRLSNCHKLSVKRNSLRKNFIFERQHIRLYLCRVKKKNVESWKQKLKELKVLN